MSRLLILLAAFLVACGGSGSGSQSAAPSPESDTASTNAPLPLGALALDPSNCPAAAAHVYHPNRLALLSGCRETSLKGTITAAKSEADGDYHVLFKLDVGQVDPKAGNYINAENVNKQHGDLILEPVCELTITQRDAVSACQDPDPNRSGHTVPYHNPIKVPAGGSHVVATGYWVFDSQHGWNELHPLTRIDKIP